MVRMPSELSERDIFLSPPLFELQAMKDNMGVNVERFVHKGDETVIAAFCSVVDKASQTSGKITFAVGYLYDSMDKTERKAYHGLVRDFDHQQADALFELICPLLNDVSLFMSGLVNTIVMVISERHHNTDVLLQVLNEDLYHWITAGLASDWRPIFHGSSAGHNYFDDESCRKSLRGIAIAIQEIRGIGQAPSRGCEVVFSTIHPDLNPATAIAERFFRQ
jgi:hypothetical protein